MMRLAGGLLAACISSLALAGEPAEDPGLTAEQVVEKNVTARGGLDAWRKVRTMIWTGHIESTHAPVPSLPFVLELKRPDKMRFEVKAQGQDSVRIYDGARGWKLSTTSSGRPEILPYTREELRFAQDGQGIEGSLMDYRAKGTAVSLDGVDEVEGRKAYRLRLVLPSGAIRHVWVDAKTFLELKYDREARNALGQSATVAVFYRDYRAVEGLQIPFLMETMPASAPAGTRPDRMMIDRVVLNPPLGDVAFAKPGVPGRRNGVPVDIRPPSGGMQPNQGLPPGFPRLNRAGPPALGASAPPGGATVH